MERGEEAYERREAEYPVMVGLYRFADPSQGGRLDRDGFVAWARERFDGEIQLDDLKSKQRDEVRSLLVQHSQRSRQQASAAAEKARQKVADLFGQSDGKRTARQSGASRGSMESLSQWAEQELRFPLAAETISDMDRPALESKLLAAVEDRFRPEMRRMERSLLLQIVDMTWKDHLLAMDHLRSSVAFVGYAQVDPKVEYKREGMKLFEQMWDVIERETSDLVFKMESLDEGFVSSTWQETSAVHAEATSATEELSRSQQQSGAASQGEIKVETIRNRGPRVGRNDPCPCGSGKKYKHCCMRLGRDVA
jgi:preprotein translocase subunit SecA